MFSINFHSRKQYSKYELTIEIDDSYTAPHHNRYVLTSNLNINQYPKHKYLNRFLR